MVDSIETCKDYWATIPLSTLKISKLCDAPSRFYESLNSKNRMCELCTFSQIQSQMFPTSLQQTSSSLIVGVHVCDGQEPWS